MGRYSYGPMLQGLSVTGRVGLQDSYCPGGADSATPTPCPAHTTSLAGSSSPAACLAAPGYYGPPGQAAEICPAVRALTQCSVSAGASCMRDRAGSDAGRGAH